MAKRKIDVTEGLLAVRAVTAASGEADRQTLATATRYLLEELAALAPGNAVEVRVPPFGATQCIAGPRHTRGTPSNVIECDPETWVALATGGLSWENGLASGAVTASGERATLAPLLPLLRLTHSDVLTQ